MIDLLVSPYLTIRDIFKISSTNAQFILLIRHHILELFELTPAERTAVLNMTHSPRKELPPSLYLRVFARDKLIDNIKNCEFIDVRTKIQLMLVIENQLQNHLALYMWFLQELYNKSVQIKYNKHQLIDHVIEVLDGNHKGHMHVDGHIFLRTSQGFRVYNGYRIVAIANSKRGTIEALQHVTSLESTFVFDTLYNNQINTNF